MHSQLLSGRDQEEEEETKKGEKGQEEMG